MDDPSRVYSSGTWFEAHGDVTFEAVYQEPPTLAITVEGFQVGKTPENCALSEVQKLIWMVCELGTPTPTITINGPDVVCAQQDYEFSVTTADGANFQEDFMHDPDDPGWDYAYVGSLTQDEDGVGHGVVSASEYGDADSMVLTVFGEAADGTSVAVTKTVQILKEHRFVDGVCGCGAVQQYTVTYDGGEGSDPVTDVKTHGEDLTLRGETFTMDGFVQTGWVDKEGAVYKLGATYTADQDVTLCPVFEKLITVTAPFTTTVALGDAGEPGETAFDLAIVGASTDAENCADVTVSGSVTTTGAGSYSGAMTFSGPERQLWYMLSEGAFVQQVDAGADGGTVDDTVYGLVLSQVAAYSTDDTVMPYTMLILPAAIDGAGNYYIDWEQDLLDKMSFTNTYTAHAYALNHDGDGHWDECAGR